MQKEIVKKELIEKIDALMKEARKNTAIYINHALLLTYLEIGRAIFEENQLHSNAEGYEQKSIRYISKVMTTKYGKGFSRLNISNMVNFYKKYGGRTLSSHLGWSHYCELISIQDDSKRQFYEKECSNSRWSVRELRRQIDSSLFERVLLSKKKIDDLQIMKLSENGNELFEPQDVLKDPFVLDFIDIPEPKTLLESDLEAALVRQIEKFMLELGKGFMFVGTQQRVTFNNVHYYADMVFYNKILKSYVLIELKSSKFIPQAVGQLNMYLNYYAAEVNDEGDNPPIGIILCTDKGNVDMQYALGGLSNNIFAAKYVTNMPKKEDLIAQVEMVTNKKHWQKVFANAFLCCYYIRACL